MQDKPLNLANPPIIEASFSLQFKPIGALHSGLVGLFWGAIRQEYPILEEHQVLTHEIEKFGLMLNNNSELLRKFAIQSITGADQRVYLRTSDLEYLIQIQKDRFVVNWLKQGSPYPRFPQLLEKYQSLFEQFTKFLANEGLPMPEVDQVELTYVNQILVDESEEPHDVFEGIAKQHNTSPALQLETFSLNLKHIIRSEDKLVGRLYSQMDKGVRQSDRAEVYNLRMVSRANPLIEHKELAGIETFKLLRNKLNENFVNLIKPEKIKEWS